VWGSSDDCGQPDRRGSWTGAGRARVFGAIRLGL